MKTRTQTAFTLVETLIATSIFSLMMAGLISITIFGMKQNELAISKAGACEQARNAMNVIANDIRASKVWQIGNGGQGTFTPIPNGTAQQGNAIQVNLTTATNTFILYYFDRTAATNNVLRRWHSGDANTTKLAQYLTNNMFFRAEDPRGNTQTNLTHKGVIHAYMEFCQYQYPLTFIGPGYYYDYYKTELRITPHVPDGP